MEVPEYFQAAVRSYDSRLRVRWSVHLERFVLEERMRNADPRVTEKMKALMYRRSQRKIADGLTKEEAKLALGHRYIASAWLEALNDGYRFLEVIPGVGSADLAIVERWLRASDQWEKAKFDGNADKAATKLALGDFYEEEFARRKRAEKMSRDNRDALKESYQDLVWKVGRRVSFAGAGR